MEIKQWPGDAEFQRLWQEAFCRSALIESGNKLQIVVHGNGLWQQSVRPWLQRNLIAGDKELIEVALVGRKGRESVKI